MPIPIPSPTGIIVVFKSGRFINILLNSLINKVVFLNSEGTCGDAAKPCHNKLSIKIKPFFFNRISAKSNSLAYPKI